MYVCDNRKASKRNYYANLVKVIYTQPMISEDKSGGNQGDYEKIKSLLLKGE